MPLTLTGIIYVLISYLLEEKSAFLEFLFVYIRRIKKTLSQKISANTSFMLVFKLTTVIRSFAKSLKSIGDLGLLQHSQEKQTLLKESQSTMGKAKGNLCWRGNQRIFILRLLNALWRIRPCEELYHCKTQCLDSIERHSHIETCIL